MTDWCWEPPPPPCYTPPPCEEPPLQKLHGNNGWGNGIDGDNPGTPKGNAEQAGTKQNKFVSLKFLFKFEGR